jgi:hypothetical protein
MHWLASKGHDTDLSNVLEALEALSCFDAWSWMDKYWKLSQQTKYAMEAMKSLAQMLTMVRDCLTYIQDAAHMPAMKEYLIRRSKEATGRDKSWDDATYESIEWQHQPWRSIQKAIERTAHPDFQVHQ